MPKAMFLNLAVADVGRSREFFKALGFSFNPQFTNDEAALVSSDPPYAVLPTTERKTAEVLLAPQVESRDEVDGLMSKVLAAGGREQRAAEDHGFMYGRAFEDPDGLIREAFRFDPARLDR